MIILMQIATFIGCLHLLIYYFRLCRFIVNVVCIVWVLRGWPMYGSLKKDYIKAVYLLAMSGQGFKIIHRETGEIRERRYF